jgi:DNA polymerase I-like protein with 3'-5' exonuclease and polymerase domains
LWILLELQRELVRLKMKSRLVLQIHDDGMGEVWEPEIADYVTLYQDIATRRVRKHWPWISVPIAVDYGICRENWFKVEEYKP